MFKRLLAKSAIAATLGLGVMIAPAFADLCASTTNCTLNFTLGNGSSGFGSGNFGTLDLSRVGTTVTITVDLAPNWFIIGTGFPGSFGFSDSLGGGLTFGGFPANYSGGTSDATSDQHFDGFGFFNNAAATTAPSAGSANALNVVSFTVSKTGLDDVEKLLNLASPVGGDGAAYFVVDAINRNTSGPGAGNTGLLAVTGGSPVPEPGLTMLLVGGIGALGWVARRRRSNGTA